MANNAKLRSKKFQKVLTIMGISLFLSLVCYIAFIFLVNRMLNDDVFQSIKDLIKDKSLGEIVNAIKSEYMIEGEIGSDTLSIIQIFYYFFPYSSIFIFAYVVSFTFLLNRLYSINSIITLLVSAATIIPLQLFRFENVHSELIYIAWVLFLYLLLSRKVKIRDEETLPRDSHLTEQTNSAKLRSKKFRKVLTIMGISLLFSLVCCIAFIFLVNRELNNEMFQSIEAFVKDKSLKEIVATTKREYLMEDKIGSEVLSTIEFFYIFCCFNIFILAYVVAFTFLLNRIYSIKPIITLLVSGATTIPLLFIGLTRAAIFMSEKDSQSSWLQLENVPLELIYIAWVLLLYLILSRKVKIRGEETLPHDSRSTSDMEANSDQHFQNQENLEKELSRLTEITNTEYQNITRNAKLKFDTKVIDTVRSSLITSLKSFDSCERNEATFRNEYKLLMSQLEEGNHQETTL